MYKGRVSMVAPKVKDRPILSDEEFDSFLAAVDREKDEFMRLRNGCVLCLLWKTGKRNSEVRELLRENVNVKEDGFVDVTFRLLKKRRHETATKTLQADKYTPYVTRYLRFHDREFKEVKHLFPSVIFNQEGIADFEDKAMTRQTLRNIVKRYSPTGWPHLFRETQGAKIVREDPTIIGVFKVKRRLDLEGELTAFRYLERYASDLISAEEGSAKT